MNKIRDFLWKKLDGVVRHTFLQQVCRETQEYADKVYSQPTSGKQEQLPKAREGWIVQHPTTWKIVEVVTREDYDFLYQKANASIAAERERVTLAERYMNEANRAMMIAMQDNQQLREQLAAAQAAIEKIDKVINGEEAVLNGKISGNLVTRIRLAIKQAGDTTTLDAAIAAAQQPLVDMLQHILDHDPHWQVEIESVLAKIR